MYNMNLCINITQVRFPLPRHLKFRRLNGARYKPLIVMRSHSNNIALAKKPKFTSGFRFQIENSKHIILYPEGKVELNCSAGKIFELCEGVKTIDEIKFEINQEYSFGNKDEINADIDKILMDALQKNWIKLI